MRPPSRGPEYEQFLARQQNNLCVNFSGISESIIRLADGGANPGEMLPWPRTHEKFHLRPGEVTIWAGVSGHGKSVVTGQVMLWLLINSKALIASMEMPLWVTAYRMIKQASGSHSPSGRYIRQWCEWSEGRLWAYDQNDSVDSESILGVVHNAGGHLGCRHVVIDSLMKCGIAPDDYGKQKDFVETLCQLAKRYNIHIHLIHHIRKLPNEYRIPDKFDVKGAGEITDLADNLVIVHRNKTKERLKEQGREIPETMPDTFLIVGKQRYTGWEGRIPLYFHEQTGQITQAPGRVMVWPVELEPVNDLRTYSL